VRGAITDVIAARKYEDGGLGRRFAYSLAAHIAIGAALILISSNFLSGKQVKPNVIEVSLAGSMGAKTTGTAPISARPVDEVKPEPKRPEPIKPVPPPKPDTMPAPTKTVTPPKVPEKAPEKAATPTPAPPPKTPSTGAQVQAGTAAIETGARGLGQGLTQAGGGGTGGAVDLNTFDQAWVNAMRDAIQKQWNSIQPETGWAEILFVVGKDGKLLSRDPVASSGSFFLTQEAMRAVGMAVFPPLPRDYKEPTLRVRLRFNYGIK
jgi:outer membrane biosynthesis protein TonB